MGHRHATFPQDPPDKQVAVAAGRILLAAEQGDALRLCPGQYPVDSLTERRALGEPAIEHVALRVVEFSAFWPAPEFPAEWEVADAAPGQSLTELSRVEMRHIAGPGHGAHIGDGLDAVLLEQAQEIVEG
jgi:hypothetical protein